MLAAMLVDCSGTDSASEAPQGTRGDGIEVLRVLYRDDAMEMLLTLPPHQGAPRPPPGCAMPLLIDTASGAVRPISQVEVTGRLRSMVLVGATSGTCLTSVMQRPLLPKGPPARA